jgi:hypothetical protein
MNVANWELEIDLGYTFTSISVQLPSKSLQVAKRKLGRFCLN